MEGREVIFKISSAITRCHNADVWRRVRLLKSVKLKNREEHLIQYLNLLCGVFTTETDHMTAGKHGL